jgi:uncharacterized repeat protein (TIGR02543 family)
MRHSSKNQEIIGDLALQSNGVSKAGKTLLVCSGFRRFVTAWRGLAQLKGKAPSLRRPTVAQWLAVLLIATLSHSCSFLAMIEAPENVLLKSLSIDGLTLSPAFNPAITEYSADLPFAWTVDVNAVPQLASCTVSGTGTFPLVGRDTVLSVNVTGTTGVSTSYTIRVTATDSSAGDVFSTLLDSLSVTGATLRPAFSRFIKDYDVIGPIYGLVIEADAHYDSSIVSGTGNFHYTPTTDTVHLVTCRNSAGQTREYSFKFKSGFGVNYEGNGSDGGTIPVTQFSEPGGSIIVADNTFSRFDHSFSGWNTFAEGTGTSYLPGASLKVNSTTYLYAQWIPDSFSLDYNGNENTGGTVPADSTVVAYGSLVTVPGNTGNLQKTGYAFGGWNTAADGTGTNQSADSTFSMPAHDVVLYAKWLPTYSVTYSANEASSGTVPEDVNLYTNGSMVTVLWNTGNLQKTGYAFGGWNTAADGTGTNESADSTFSMPAHDVVLHAKWLPMHSVTYSANEASSGTVPEDANLYTNGSMVTVSGNTGNLQKTGYAFGGWNTAADGTGTNESADSTFYMPADDVVLYAIWLPTYSVTYSANEASSGTVPEDANLYTNGSMVTVLGNTGNLQKTGYPFGGWNTAADGTGTNRSADSTFSMPAHDVILYAKWLIAVSQVSCGSYHAMIVKTDGSLWATGYNYYGQLGDGTTTARSTPVQVMSGIAAVSAGASHTMILKIDGSLWATGYNSSGQLGDGTTTNRSTPVQIMTGVAAVSAGNYHTMILKTDGSLWATGYNEGALGDGTTTNRSTPVQVMTGVAAISAGAGHTMILKTDGSLWATGYNYYGQLGDGTTTSRSTPAQVMTGVSAVSTRAVHTMILKTDGSLWATGNNFLGALGDGTSTDRSTPVQVMTEVVAISAGYSYTMILKTDGSLWATGNNFYGSLGDGTTTSRSTPVQVMTGVAAVSTGSSYTMILKTDGSLWATGQNGEGQLGNGTTTNRSTPEQIIF